MDPICFHLGPRPVYWYGIMVAAAFLACMLHLTWRGKKEGRPAAFVSDLGFWIMVCAILGARAAYVVANWGKFTEAPGEIIRIDKGGLVFYGGFLGAWLATVIFARVRRESLWSLWDFLATTIPLGHAIGRLGCFLNSCCYGAEGRFPWSVFMEGRWRHPVQLYEALFNLALFAFLNWFYPRRRRDGRVAALYLMLYPLGRFCLEFFRGDERLGWLGLNAAQWTSLLLILCGLAFWHWRSRVNKFQTPNSNNRSTALRALSHGNN
jgi:phosphatidylglycerol:prolipoprotein diacylglycerol transferase